MVMLTEEAQARIRAAIERVEAQSELEFVTVLTAQSDGYYFIPTLWAAMTALFLPLLLLMVPAWLEVADVVLIQLTVFSVLTAVLRFGPIMYRVVPRSVLRHRACNMAHRQFLDQGVHRTRDGTGVLLFVSEAEHYVEVIADSGLDGKISDAQWHAVVDRFTEHVRRGEIEAGFLAAIEAVGALGQAVVPATRSADELPNHLIILD